jgi:hypothetical protein
MTAKPGLVGVALRWKAIFSAKPLGRTLGS